MRLPGSIQPGTVFSQPVSQIDFMPTIMDYVGQPIPDKIHGRSMRPLVEGRDVRWRDYAFSQRADHARMLRTEQYKFFQLSRSRGVALYDLANDPNEDHNLAADPRHAKTVRQMHARLLDVMTQDGDPAREAFAKLPS
jgi:arylsulfatase A-like enzyme